MDYAGPFLLAVLVAAGVPLMLALHWRTKWRRQQRLAETERVHAQQVFDALDIGLLVFDAEDRVVQWNADYLRLYPSTAERMEVGMRFEDLLRLALTQELIPEAVGREDAWVAERLALHRKPRGPILRQMADGRWRRISERYLADGGMLSYSIDVTALVDQGGALQRAQRDAEQARAQLQDALDALPAGLEWFDAQDRLVLANRQSRELFPLIRHLLDDHPTFEQVVRANHAAGGLASLPCDIDTWIQRRLAQRRSGHAEHLLNIDGRWIRVHESRTRDGGMVSVRLDVTAEITEREGAERARRQLHDAIEALPDGFALYDADDRLVLCNERYRSIYRESAPALRTGARFEDLLRYGLAQGQYPQAAGREEAWLAERVRAHREPGPPLLQELPGNRWLRVDERRTRDGGVAGVRADVTALVRREQSLEQLNRQLDSANAHLANLLGQDTDTGTANTQALARALETEWARTRRHGTPLALIIVRLDAAAGDDADAGEVAQALRTLVRHLMDWTRRPGDILARTGPRQFELLLPHTGTVGVASLMQRFADACPAALSHASPQIGAAASDESPPPPDADALRAWAGERCHAAPARRDAA